jgi:hypothetical protein
MSESHSTNGAAGWHDYDNGLTRDRRGVEGGTVLIDEEHADGARITLERDTLHRVPFAITCSIYGWMVHTRFFADEPSASAAYNEMKTSLARILLLIASQAEPEAVSEAVETFVEEHP